MFRNSGRSTLAALAMFAALFFHANTAHAEGIRFAIYNLDTANCLDVAHAATTPGAGLIQYHCTGGTNQLWQADVVNYATSGGGAIVVLRNANSGLCLDLAQQSAAPGVGLVQNTCNGSTSQQWVIDPPWQSTSIGGGNSVATVRTWRHIKNQFSGLCIDNVSPGGDYTPAQQWTCISQNNQLWRVPLF